MTSFNGSAHYAAFANSTYIGASGHIKFRETFPTRTAESSYFVMANLIAVPVDNSTLVRFKGSPVIDYFDTLTSSWQQLPGKEFMYAGGSSIPPEELVPVNQNMSASAIVAIVLAVSLVSVISISLLFRRRITQKESKAWEVDPGELKFDDSPVVIGRGTFGLVLLAEYRGTTVAVKRVIPPREMVKSRRGSSSSSESVGVGKRGRKWVRMSKPWRILTANNLSTKMDLAMRIHRPSLQ